MSSTFGLAVYASTTALMCFLPGPSALMVASTAAQGGIRHVPAAVSGISLANILLFCLFGVGATSLLTQFPEALTLMRGLGIAYLLWLGFRLLTHGTDPGALAGGSPFSRRHTLVKAFLIHGSNPKSLLYFCAVLPQFISPDQSIASQLALLCLITLAFDVMAYSAYGMLGMRLSKFSGGGMAKWTRRATGGLLVMAGVKLFRG